MNPEQVIHDVGQNEILEGLAMLAESMSINKIEQYDPYGFQLEFHNEGLTCSQVLLMAANRVGKSFCGAAEMTYHLTGLYPEWWDGHRFDRPIKAWAGGASNETTRDIVQSELLGEAGDPTKTGTGSIPRHLIGETTRKPGVPNALNAVMIKHVSGWSKLAFKAYEMGAEKWMGEAVDYIWLDEEPPQSIFTQCMTRTLSTGGLTKMTFTPESGATEVVSAFMTDLQPGQALVNATWEDAPHLTPDKIKQLLAALPEHERDMRSKGIPMVGAGLVFPVSDDMIRCDPFNIPDHFALLKAIDFGWDHPTAVAWGAYDRDNDIIYIYKVFRQRQAKKEIVAAAINATDKEVKVIWPHDGNKSGEGGRTLAQQYKDLNVNMHYEQFYNPPAMGKDTGDILIEPGIMNILSRMETGRFKVFRNLSEWFEEKRLYHRHKDTGKIVDKKDDLMSTSRYIAQSLRYARPITTETRYDRSDGNFDVYG
ncbi:MAG: hypothetical protein IME93_03145 [Proteobacteria bacterium]|nr:hypothetical protein [Pseudomonadota bacterium]